MMSRTLFKRPHSLVVLATRLLYKKKVYKVYKKKRVCKVRGGEAFYTLPRPLSPLILPKTTPT